MRFNRHDRRQLLQMQQKKIQTIPDLDDRLRQARELFDQEVAAARDRAQDSPVLLAELSKRLLSFAANVGSL